MFIIYLYRNIITGKIFFHYNREFVEFILNNMPSYIQCEDHSYFIIKNSETYKPLCYFNVNIADNEYKHKLQNIFDNIDYLYDFSSGYHLHYKDILQFSIKESILYRLLYINYLYKKNMINLNKSILDKIYIKLLLKCKLNKIVIENIKLLLN